MNRKNVLRYCLVKFAVAVVISIVVWTLIFNGITAPKDYQTINVFISAAKADGYEIRSRVQSARDVKRADVTTVSEKDVNYAVMLSTVGINDCDILILPKSAFTADGDVSSFAPLTGVMGADEERYSFLSANGVNYALVVFDKQNGIDLLGDLVEFDDDQVYCMAINATRPNAAPYSDGKHTTDNAFAAFAALIQR